MLLLALVLMTQTPQQILDQLPPGSTIEFQTTRTSDGGSRTEKSEGVGAGARASGDGKLQQNVTGSAPEAGIGFAKGGSVNAETTVTPASRALLIAGILALLASGASVYLRLPVRTSIIIAAVGIGLIALDFFPGLALLGVLGAVVLAGFYIYSEFQAGRKIGELRVSHEALRSVAAGISDLKRVDPAVYEKAKERIGAQVEDAEKAVIDRIKKEDRL
jgi:hypothetical protein